MTTDDRAMLIEALQDAEKALRKFASEHPFPDARFWINNEADCVAEVLRVAASKNVKTEAA